MNNPQFIIADSAMMSLYGPVAKFFLAETDLSFQENPLGIAAVIGGFVPMGLVSCTFSADTPSAEVLSLYVEKRYQNQGMEIELLQRLTSLASKKQCTYLSTLLPADIEAFDLLCKTFLKENWSSPVPYFYSYRLSAQKGCAHLKEVVPENAASDFTILPWSELSKEERLAFPHDGKSGDDPVWEGLIPLGNNFEKLNSLYATVEGEPAAWIITKRERADTISYRSLYIRKKFRATNLALRLLKESFIRQVEAAIPLVTCFVNYKNQRMLHIMDKYFGNSITSTQVLHRLQKVLP